jgi:heme/copper-type cytochrome/quinol oxidase subunit 2
MLLPILFFVAGIAIIGIGALSIYSESKKTENTKIEIPLLGRVETRVPAIALCFLGLVPFYFTYSLATSKPTMVKFDGQVAIDPTSLSGIDAITVGVTSGLWSQTTTPDTSSPTIKVTIPVPDSWPTYTAYAFALGGPQTRPAIIGTSLDNPQFKLRIGK